MDISASKQLHITEMDGNDGFSALFNKLISGERVIVNNRVIDAEMAITSMAQTFAESYEIEHMNDENAH